MKATLWGTRGSVPVSGAGYERFGGATTCVTFQCGRDILLVDAGTGLLKAAAALSQPDVRWHQTFTHYHYDHIQGLPFFGEIYRPGGNVSLWARDPAQSLATLSQQMEEPFFPVPWAVVAGNFTPRQVHNDAFTIGEMKVTIFDQHHPGGSIGLRVEGPDQTVAFLTDQELDAVTTEATSGRRHPPEWLLKCLVGVDTIVADGQYTEDEYKQRVGWGHPRATTLVDLASEVGARRLVVTHHDPAQTDDAVEAKLAECHRRMDELGVRLDIEAAYDGLCIEGSGTR